MSFLSLFPLFSFPKFARSKILLFFLFTFALFDLLSHEQFVSTKLQVIFYNHGEFSVVCSKYKSFSFMVKTQLSLEIARLEILSVPQFDKLDFQSISNWIFTACVACKNQFRICRLEIQFIELDYLNFIFQKYRWIIKQYYRQIHIIFSRRKEQFFFIQAHKLQTCQRWQGCHFTGVKFHKSGLT